MRPSIGRPRFIGVDDALAWQDLAIAQYGGAPGVRDLGLSESAVAQARQGFGGSLAHAFPFEMAAAYAFHVAKNHPFVDGNKRVALLCAGGFLRMNGWDLASGGTAAADAVLELVEGRMDRAAFAAWLERNCRPRPSFELRDFFASLSRQQLAECLQVFIMPPSMDEADATGFEALEAMPAMAGLMQAYQHFEKSGQASESQAMAMAITVRVAIYRIAEDMSYEW